MTEWRVPLADLDYGIEEETAVVEVLRSRWLTMGAVTQEFEREFAVLTGSAYALSVSNATEALHLACLALGIGAGDEVITPSLSFVATSNAVLYTGADVRLADVIGPQDLTIDPEEIDRLVTPRTKAVIVMHYAGYPCQMDRIVEKVRRYGIALIEDVAHAPGGRLDGRGLGTFGDVGCFSFFSNKNLSTGEGGMLVTDRDDLAARFKLLRSHGMTTLTYDRHHGHAYSYDVVALGYNDRIDEIRSALGRVQLAKLPANNALRKQWTRLYQSLLAGSGLELPFQGAGGQAAYHLFPVLLPAGAERKKFMDGMRAAGIQTSIHYPPTHLFTYYRERYGEISLPRTERLAAREVTLPLYPGMGQERVEYVAQAVRQALEAAC